MVSSRRNSKRKLKRKRRLILVGVICVVTLFIGFGYFNSSLQLQAQLAKKISAQDTTILVPVETATTTPSPTLSPEPSATPTLVPVPSPTGFCLNVPVLFYHHIEDLSKAQTEGHKFETVAPEIFDSQMQYLVSNGYRTIKAEELISGLYSHQNLGKVAVVTLDDGYDDSYSNAYPIAKKYGVVLNLMIPTGLLENSGFMSWSQLKEMASNGEAAYDHTWSHYSLNQGDDAKVTTEIMTAKQQLDQHLGTNVNIFTYPYGSYSQRVVNILQANGFKAAFTTNPGTLQCEGNAMFLPRTRIGNAPLSAYGI